MLKLNSVNAATVYNVDTTVCLPGRNCVSLQPRSVENLEQGSSLRPKRSHMQLLFETAG